MGKTIILITVVFTIIILFTLTSCNSNYVMLSHNIKSEGIWNSTQTKFVFVGEAYAYKNASGISSFPDGGQAKVLHKKINLYIYDTIIGKLSILADLTDLPDSKHFTTNFYLKDSLVYYEHYAINITSGIIDEIDSTVFSSLKEDCKDNKRISSYELKKKIYPATISEWGLELQKIHPKSDKDYIKDLIDGKNGGSKITRKAIIEQIVSKKSKSEILDILKKMDENANSLEGSKKSLYENSLKESHKYINELLAKKD